MKVKKIKSIEFNNRKKLFEIDCSDGSEYLFPYSQLAQKPRKGNFIVRVFPDLEVGKLAFTYCLKDGTEDTVPLDAVLSYNQDPELMRKARLYDLTCKAQNLLRKKKITNSELARRMGSSSVQVARLLDQTFYGKTTDQMIKLLNALDCDVEIRYKNAS